MPLLQALLRFLFPAWQLAAESGFFFEEPVRDKPSLCFFKGGGSTVKVSKAPDAPVINIPAPPTPPAPPSPEATQSVYDLAQAQQQGAQQQAAGFGYSASLLRAPLGFQGQAAQTGPNGSTNSATGAASLLGGK